MTRPWIIMVASLAVLAGLLLLLREPDSGSALTGGDQSGAPTVHLLCAASNRAVVDAVAKQYEEEYAEEGVRVAIDYGPSQTLLTTAEVAATGDLYLPADDSYLEIAAEKNLIDEILPLARMQAVIVVTKENPKGVSSFEDLLREDVRVVQASPDGAAIGKMTKRVLSESGRWETLDQHTMAYRTTVTDVANDVKVGSADAGIVFDAVLSTYPELKAVEIPELEPAAANCAVSVLKSCRNPQRALHFARYLAARDRGLLEYERRGFTPVEGDVWADKPRVTLYAGSMLRPAIERTIQEFERREGAVVESKYNGCGILVAQMKAGEMPDAYFACDTEFMKQVEDQFLPSTDVSQNELVIIVQKGNPLGIAGLRDLAKPGLRVGIGHEKQCAMGWLTQNVLREGGVREEIMPNVTTQLPTGDMLVNNMLAGSLDAAVVYLSNAAGSADELDAVAITDLECSIATQPYAVAREAQHPQLAARLYEAIMSAQSQTRFESVGFRWEALTAGEEPTPPTDSE
ncbi:MAG: molybdate ABC transporter substrate-binding protein [Planctomycetota bacterium]|nr:MAG: molybdate ABC transporter substrate-binding protein [Planctomycetota bacterium]REJ96214.1 MAG: molybdate ABC transporter substrate-binding protein [Planctomycetota bacterium]REK24470.1 MAG: molybdate ABC transporter substrate-binding protein [Planctomycetota bacterium]REK38659.1 MAG: molybdate ABC transporter substrate-binding protein [Planctomycetota bacterium]